LDNGRGPYAAVPPYPGAMTNASASGRTPGAGPADPGPAAGDAPRTPLRPAPPGLVFDDPLTGPSADDSDRGWGEGFSGTGDDDFTRFLNEKPPHHI
jgi:hypothetical protein